MVVFKESKQFELLGPHIVDVSGTYEEVADHIKGFRQSLESIPTEKSEYSYSPNKWTVKELLGHVVDSHIIVLFRLLSFSRGEVQPLPGADESLWVTNSEHKDLSLRDIIAGYEKASNLTEWVLKTLPKKTMQFSGNANGVLLTVQELHTYLIGHERHHLKILKDRYLA